MEDGLSKCHKTLEDRSCVLREDPFPNVKKPHSEISSEIWASESICVNADIYFDYTLTCM